MLRKVTSHIPFPCPCLARHPGGHATRGSFRAQTNRRTKGTRRKPQKPRDVSHPHRRPCCTRSPLHTKQPLQGHRPNKKQPKTGPMPLENERQLRKATETHSPWADPYTSCRYGAAVLAGATQPTPGRPDPPNTPSDRVPNVQPKAPPRRAHLGNKNHPDPKRTARHFPVPRPPTPCRSRTCLVFVFAIFSFFRFSSERLPCAVDSGPSSPSTTERSRPLQHSPRWCI